MILAQECVKRWLIQAKNRSAEKKIVNFTFINTFQGNLESVMYATSKEDILQIIKTMSNEWAQWVKKIVHCSADRITDVSRYSIMINSIASDMFQATADSTKT